MYQVSDKYKAAIKSLSRYSKIKGTITLKSGTIINLNDDNIVSGTLGIDNQCVNGEELCFGSVYAAQLRFSFNSDIDRYSIYDGVIKLSYFLLVDANVWEEVPLGVFTVTEATRKFSTIAITALDNMIFLDAVLDATNTNGNSWELLKYVSKKTGVELSQTQAEILAIPNANHVYGLPVNGGGISTYRDLVADLSQILGCFVTMDRLGKLVLKPFKAVPNIEIDVNGRTDSSISDFKVFYTALNIITDKKVFSAAAQYNDGLTMIVKDNGLMINGVDDFKQLVTNELFKVLTSISYTPCDIGYKGDPALDLGDMMSLPESAVNCLITNYKWIYRGNHTLKGVGKNPRSVNAKSKSDKDLDNINTNMAEGKVGVAVYENAVDYNITPTWTEIIRMDYVVGKDSNPLFCGAIDISLIAHGELEFKYENNQGEIAFYPKQLLPKGNHHIILHLPIINILEGLSNVFKVFVRSTEAKAHIAPACIKADIIASGLNGASGMWDGRLEFEEAVGLLTIPKQNIKISAFTAELQPIVLPPTVNNGITVSFDALTIRQRQITLKPIDATLAVGTVFKSNTIMGAEIITTNKYLAQHTDPGMKLKTNYQIDGANQHIDSGKLLSFDVDTSSFGAVTKIEVV